MCEAVVIESNALITIVVGAASTILSGVATWFFAKRRYAVQTGPVTEKDLEMEKLRIQSRSDVLGFILALAFGLRMLAFIALLFLPVLLQSS